MTLERYRSLLEHLIRRSPLPVVTERAKFPKEAATRGWYTDGDKIYLEVHQDRGSDLEEGAAIASLLYLLGVARMFLPRRPGERFQETQIQRGTAASFSCRLFAAKVMKRLNLAGDEELIQEIRAFDGDYAGIDWKRIDREAAEIIGSLEKALEVADASRAPAYDARADFPIQGLDGAAGRNKTKRGYREFEWVREETRGKGQAWQSALTGLPDYQVADHIPLLDYGSSSAPAAKTPIRALYLLRDGRVVLGKSLHVRASSRAREALKRGGDERFVFAEEKWLERLRAGDFSSWPEPLHDNFQADHEYREAVERYERARNGNPEREDPISEMRSMSHIVREKSNENAFIAHAGAIRIAMASTKELNLFILFSPSRCQRRVIERFSSDLDRSHPIAVTFDYLDARRGVASEEHHCFAGRLLSRDIPLALRLTTEGRANQARELLAVA